MTLSPELARQIHTLSHRHRLVLLMDGPAGWPRTAASARACHVLDGLGIDYAQVDALDDPADAAPGAGGPPGIPQLYLDGRAIGDADAIVRMTDTGELQAALGLPPPDRRPPQVQLTPQGAQALREALQREPGDAVAELILSPRLDGCLRLVQRRPEAIAVAVDGVPLQFDLASARRAEGLSIHWQDIERGDGLILSRDGRRIEPVLPIAPAEADARVRAGTLTLVDVRDKYDRAAAEVPIPFLSLDEDSHTIRNLPPQAALATLCHRGDRSRYAAAHLYRLGHREIFYVEGGIDAWAETVDGSIPRY